MEQNAKVFTVTAVGHKYIKAGGYNFDKETLRCADLNYSLFIGTPEEFRERIHAERKVRKLMDKVSWHLKDCSLNDRRFSVMSSKRLPEATNNKLLLVIFNIKPLTCTSGVFLFNFIS